MGRHGGVEEKAASSSLLCAHPGMCQGGLTVTVSWKEQISQAVVIRLYIEHEFTSKGEMCR